MAELNWSASSFDWTDFLRVQGFRIGIGDELRVQELLRRLRDARIELRDVDAVVRWLGPVLCQNAWQQEHLPRVLKDFATLRQNTEPTTVQPATAQVAEALRLRRTWPWLTILALVLIAAAVGAGILLWLNGTFVVAYTAQPVAPTPTSSSLDVKGWLPLAARRAIASIIPIGLCGLALIKRRRKHAVLLRGLVPRDAKQEAIGIPLKEIELFQLGQMRPILADLRRHRLVPSHGIDAAATVGATTEYAGFVQLVYARRPALPNYLLLVDLAGSDDHMGVLADLLMDRLRAEDVSVDRFDFQGDPRWLCHVDGSEQPPT